MEIQFSKIAPLFDYGWGIILVDGHLHEDGYDAMSLQIVPRRLYFISTLQKRNDIFTFINLHSK